MGSINAQGETFSANKRKLLSEHPRLIPPVTLQRGRITNITRSGSVSCVKCMYPLGKTQIKLNEMQTAVNKIPIKPV